ncbi:MAG: DUF222 domain-containing protein [Chloroflexi bacterium]|nr:MAG: DUF222 domain-containing protein [Chloroflexota bacterium]
MTAENPQPSLIPEDRLTVLAAMSGDIDRYHAMDKASLLPEQHASSLITLALARDRLAIEMAEHVAELSKSRACVDEWGSVSTQDWVRHQCNMPSGVAGDLLHVAEQLPNLTKTVEAVGDGKIGFAHAAIIARHAQAITHSESAEPFDERPFLKAAEESSVSRLWYYSMHAWHRADPQGVTDAQRQAVEERYLRFTDGADGTVYVKGAFDSAAGATIKTAMEPMAQPLGDGDLRSRERRYGDAWVEMAAHSLDTGIVPQHGSVRPHVQVTTTLETLQGLIGAPAGEMALSLPISAKTVQRFACDSSITRVLLGADSAVIEAGRAKRVVAGGTRRLLDARDKHCRWPGCERPASWSAAHHILHWAQGGKTDLSNMILLCQHHHWMVHEGGWRLSLAADGRVLAIPPETDFYPPEFYPSARAPDEFDVA